MATAPDAIRNGLQDVSDQALADIQQATEGIPPESYLAAYILAAGLIVPSYYDAAGSLAVSWYEELREEAQPQRRYEPTIIGEGSTSWIEREVEAFRVEIERDIEDGVSAFLKEQAYADALIQKEIAGGFRTTIDGNVERDDEAVGWSRHTRPGACKFCLMLAERGAVYSKEFARFAAHTSCNCVSRAEFRNGDLGPEASPLQYVATQRKRTAAQKAQLRAYLTEHFPDAPG